ncbi:unnamed protein product [Rotaria sp. Silwood1]|nr:unnamed protein product [Rotaria sp. Silwood1]
MWNSQLVIYIFILNCCLYFTVHSHEKILIHDRTNSTNEKVFMSSKDSLPIWTNKQFIICFVSVSLGTLLFFITFIVPAMIIIRRARRDKNRLDLREFRRMSDFI